MLTFLLLSSVASADQCSWVSKANADAALEHLTSGAAWLSYCEPCGDAEPSPGTVETASAGPVSDGRFWQVQVDGKPVDLAYVFVKAGPGDTWYTNLAKLVDCQASMVSRKVTWPLGTQQADRLKSWIGTYTQPKSRLKVTQFFDDPNVLAIQLDHPTEHGSGAATLELVSSVDIDQDPLTFATPFGDCRVALAKVDSGVSLTPDAACSGLLEPIAGSYRKID